MIEKIFSEVPYDQLWQWALTFCKNAVLAVIVYFIGRWVIKWVVRLATKMMNRSKIDPTLYSFLNSIISVVLWLTLSIIIISILGIETSSFIALFASAGVAIGMALSGTLQNFAGGVMILLFKPFRVGDFIEAQGYVGTVKEIQIFNTIVRTNDAQTIIIPNGGLSTGSMKNYSTEPYRRVDVEFQFVYGTDYEKVRQAISEIQLRNPLIMQQPLAEAPNVAAPWIGLTKLGESGVVVTTRSWCKSADYWAVMGYMKYEVYQQLRNSGFMFPFNKLDVTVIKE